MLKKLLRQRTIPWVGGFKETLSQALWWGTVINFAMLAGTFYYTTLRHIWTWFDLPKFILIILVGAMAIYIIEYKFIVPSIWAFRSKQMFEYKSQITDKLNKLGEKLDELDKKISNTGKEQ